MLTTILCLVIAGLAAICMVVAFIANYYRKERDNWMKLSNNWQKLCKGILEDYEKEVAKTVQKERENIKTEDLN